MMIIIRVGFIIKRVSSTWELIVITLPDINFIAIDTADINIGWFRWWWLFNIIGLTPFGLIIFINKQLFIGLIGY